MSKADSSGNARTSDGRFTKKSTNESPYDELPDGSTRIRKRKLTRTERLQMAADAGYDTWDDYNGEK